MTRSTADKLLGLGPAAAGRFLMLLEKISPRLKDRVARKVAGFHVWAFRRTGGTGRLFGRPGAPTLLLTTTGRKSGQPRTTALFYLPDGDRQILVASYGGDPRNPQWFQNLEADPKVTVQIGEDAFPALATVLTGPEREQVWPKAVANWPGYADYQERTTRQLPVVALTCLDG